MKKILLSLLLTLLFALSIGTVDIKVSANKDTSSWALLQDAFAGKGESCAAFDYSKDENNVITVVLKENILASETSEELKVFSGREVKLDLNGFELNANGKLSSHRVIRIAGKLTVSDSSDKTKDGSGTGKITGGRLLPVGSFEMYAKDGAGILVEKEAEFTLNSGCIYNNQAATSSLGGGGVACFGKFTMNGGAIQKNKARWGGGIGLEKNTVFVMNGGRIFENESVSMDGSAINCYYDYSSQEHGDNHISLLGGEIYGNKSNYTTDNVDDDETVNGVKSAGCAVWVEGELVLGGNIKIYDNYQGEYNESTGEWTNLTNDANLAIVELSDADRGSGRYTVKLSEEKPLKDAEIYLSKTSEVLKVVPIKEGDNLVDYGYGDEIFQNGNYKFFKVDNKNGEAFSLNKEFIVSVSKSGLPTGAIIGIIIGGCLLAGGCTYVFLRRKNSNKENENSENN